MKIGFATQNRFDDAGAVYECMSELAGGNAGDYLKMVSPDKPEKFDIIVADSLEYTRELGLCRSDYKMLVVFGGKRQMTADLLLASSDAHRQHHITSYDWGPQHVRMIGRPCMDLLWGTPEEKEGIRQIYLHSHHVNKDLDTVVFRMRDGVGKKMLKRFLDWTGDKLNVIVSPADQKYAWVDEEYPNATLDSRNDFVTLLLSANVLVTDRDDLAIDYLALNRPVVFLNSPGTSCPWWYDTELPGPCVTKTKTLIHAVENRNDFPKRFVERRKIWQDKFIKQGGSSSLKAVKAIMDEWKKHDI